MAQIDRSLSNARKDFFECLQAYQRIEYKLPSVVVEAMSAREAASVSGPAIAVGSEASGGTQPQKYKPAAASAAESPAAPVASDWKELELQLRDLREINERVMAQNLSLLDDVEALQKYRTGLSQENASLALQLRRALLARDEAKQSLAAAAGGT